MTGTEIFEFICKKISERYQNVNKSFINDLSSYTTIFKEIKTNYSNDAYKIKLSIDEFPILECTISNNYFLMTTYRMISIFNGELYELAYEQYWWFDSMYFNKNLPLVRGEIKTFKYFSKAKEEFFYQIDSGKPADAAHSCILYNMRRIYYSGSVTYFPG